MHPIWVIQLSVDVLLLALACWWIWDRRRYSQIDAMEQRLRATVTVIEERIQKQENQWRELTAAVQGRVAALDRICDEATRILERSQSQMGTSAPTREERELLAVVGSDSIPKMNEVDQTRKRLKGERLFDLAQVLNDQLS